MRSHPASLLASLVILASAEVYQTSFPSVKWDNDAWTLTTTVVGQGHYESRASLANGYFGINLAALGPFFEVGTPVDGDDISGWPLFDRRQSFATIAGFYDVQPTTNGTNYPWLNQYGGESVISGVPHWAGLHLQCNNHNLDAITNLAQITKFKSSFNFQSGVLSWAYTWTPPGCAALGIEYTALVHKLYVNQAAIQLKITPSEDVSGLLVFDVLNGDGAVRSHFVGNGYDTSADAIWTEVQPTNIPYVSAWIYSSLRGDSIKAGSKSVSPKQKFSGMNSSSIALSAKLAPLSKGKTVTLEKYIGIASTDAFENPQSVAKNASSKACAAAFQSLLLSHESEWQTIMTADSVDDYALPNGTLPNHRNILEQQILAVTNPFGILQNTVGPNALEMAGPKADIAVNSIAVGGLGSDSYAGLIFWDVEVWMSPGIVVSHPQAMYQVANYRAAKYEQAKANVNETHLTSQNQTHFSNSAAIYPWTSGRFGNCTGTGPCFDYEYHINGDIGLELLNLLIATGDTKTFEETYLPIYDSIAEVYSNLLYLNTTTNTYMLPNATDPDEYANFVDNPAYTMVLIKTHLEKANRLHQQFDMSQNQMWAHQAANIETPTSKQADIFLEYSGMNGSILVKQADVVLIDDFLHYPNQYSLSDLDYYASKQTLNGPAMTFGVFSIVAAEYSPSGCSDYTYHLYGSQPYARAPWFQFSEQLVDDYAANGGTHPAFPFLTGMGGANRVAVYGYLGLKFDLDSLNINPSLPPQIPNIRYRRIFWQGWGISAYSNQTHTILKQNGRKLSTANPDYAKEPIPVTVGNDTTIQNLTTSGSLTFPTRQIGNIKTLKGNVAQCKAVVSFTGSFLPGQFPLSAVDGASSTKWQPVLADDAASLTVDLGDDGLQPIIGFIFDWAQAPPASYNITFSNSSTGKNPVLVYSSDEIKISSPYDPKTAANLVPYMSNMTNVTLSPPVWGGRYATLIIMGNEGNSSHASPGATVAEWAIIAKT